MVAAVVALVALIAVAMKCPAQVYTPSKRPYQGLPDLDYPFHDRDVLVTVPGHLLGQPAAPSILVKSASQAGRAGLGRRGHEAERWLRAAFRR